jgi:hypothetical protein
MRRTLPAVLAFFALASLPFVSARRVGAQPPPLAPLSTVPADVPQAMLDAGSSANVVVRARVGSTGMVDSAVALSGLPAARASAAAAVRWWIFPPRTPPAWTEVRITLDGTSREPAPRPDVLAMAREAERSGDAGGAMMAWMGALGRVGRHPSIQNEWAIREHIARLRTRLAKPPVVAGTTTTPAIVARIRQQRVLASAEHADVVDALDKTLLAAPWWDDPYQWRAASEAGCGRVYDAMRSLRMLRMVTADSAMRARADRGIAGLAAGDTLRVSQMLKLEGRQFNEDGEIP